MAMRALLFTAAFVVAFDAALILQHIYAWGY